MEKKIMKKSGLRTATKILSFINLAFALILVGLAIAMVIFSLITLRNVTGKTDPSSIRWRNVSNTHLIMSYIVGGVGLLSLALSVPTIIFAMKSMNFGLLLAFGILHVLTGAGLVLGALMIATACVDCGPWLNKKK